MSILSYFTPSSVGSTQPEPGIEGALEIEAAPEIEAEPQPETGPQIDESNATTFDESTNQPSQLIQEFHPSQIIHDPGLRIPIDDYAPEIRSDVRRAYLLNGRNKAVGHKDKRWHYFEIISGTLVG